MLGACFGFDQLVWLDNSDVADFYNDYNLRYVLTYKKLETLHYPSLCSFSLITFAMTID
jgi:hypothetical protein